MQQQSEIRRQRKSMRKYFTQKYSNFVETVKNRDMQAQERRNKTSGEEKFRNGK